MGSVVIFLLYEQWFLPYSGDVNQSQHIFYFCRSVRVDMDQFVFGSENRRIERKAEELWISYEISNKSDFDIFSDEFCNFCLWYSQERFSNGGFDSERFDYVVSRDICNKIMKFAVWELTIGMFCCVNTEKVCIIGSLFLILHWLSVFR